MVSRGFAVLFHRLSSLPSVTGPCPAALAGNEDRTRAYADVIPSSQEDSAFHSQLGKPYSCKRLGSTITWALPCVLPSENNALKIGFLPSKAGGLHVHNTV
jgi:hypothetical protein